MGSEMCIRDSNNPDDPDFEVRDVNNITSYHYSLMRSCLLKKEYEYDNNFKYDYVVRMRTDAMIHNKIKFESLLGRRSKIRNRIIRFSATNANINKYSMVVLFPNFAAR